MNDQSGARGRAARRSYTVGPALSIGAAAWLGLWSAWCQEPLLPTRALDSVRIEVIWISTQAELDARAEEYRTKRPVGGVIKQRLEAFSVLGKRDGELVCLIFARKPARFDDRNNTSLGHELLHCFGFSHSGG